MRPVNEQADYSIATDVKDGKVRVVVTALKKDGEFLNFLHMSAVGTRAEDGKHQHADAAGSPGPLRGGIARRPKPAATCWPSIPAKAPTESSSRRCSPA